MFTRHDLDRLIAIEDTPVVSIFMPTHRAGREMRQGPVRFRALTGQARDALQALSLRRSAAEGLLAPAERLLADEAFWRHQDQGLAVFVAPNVCFAHRVPLALREQLVVGPRVHVTPLLPLLEDDGRFLVLALSARRARLFDGSRHGLAEVTDIDLPVGREAIERETDYEKNRHAPPSGRPRSGAPKGAPRNQAFGETPEALRKTELIEFLHRVVAALDTRVRAARLPLVLVAQPEIDGNFRGLARWDTLLADTVAENPEALDSTDLHAKAYALVRERFAEAQRAALDRLNHLVGIADAKATLRIEEIVRAAQDGRVDTLLLADDAELWGSVTQDHQVVAHGSPVPGDEELFDRAAIETLRRGGHVGLMPRAALPRQQPAAAILRY
jgi:hypothetical protein